MRTTLRLDGDVAAAVERLRTDKRSGLSENVNDLIRAGLMSGPEGRRTFRQRSEPFGLRIGVANVADALEELRGRVDPAP